MPSPAYARALTRAQTFHDLAGPVEQQYWEGYRTGMRDGGRDRRPAEPAWRDVFAADLGRAARCRGYADGLTWDAPAALGWPIRLTPAEFAEHYGPEIENAHAPGPRGLTNVESVRQACRGDVVNGYRRSLPPGWRAQKIGASWFLIADVE